VLTGHLVARQPRRSLTHSGPGRLWTIEGVSVQFDAATFSEGERDHMAEERAERRLAAILAADVVGYSRLMEQDEAGTLAALKSRRREILQPVVSKHHGRMVKLMGDGVLVEFASAVNAVACAVELQRGMAEANADAPEDRRIVLRVGINLGDVMVEGSDLYGDGVNIAARIEGLAGPGEIWIAASVHDQIENKASGLSFEDLGPREMKNLARPVRVLRVVTGLPAEKQLAGKPLPSAQPSIAVLPFTNMSGDPGQDFITDGITENIIADLSRFRDLAVISRQSTFAYKGKAVKVQEVSRELGARYILEGSLQKPGERVRITAQLIDGATGQHLWTERYSRKVDDIFAMLDEVTETIVVTLAAGYGGRLHKAWRTRAGKSGQRTFEAYDCFSRSKSRKPLPKRPTTRPESISPRPSSLIPPSRRRSRSWPGRIRSRSYSGGVTILPTHGLTL
jgi:adenylate cyclase